MLAYSYHGDSDNLILNPVDKPITSLPKFYLVAVGHVKEGG